MSYLTSPELAEKVRRLMESGKYQNEDELMLDALRALDALEATLEPWKADVEARVEEAETEESKPLDADSLMAEIRAEVAPIEALKIVHGSRSI